MSIMTNTKPKPLFAVGDTLVAKLTGIRCAVIAADDVSYVLSIQVTPDKFPVYFEKTADCHENYERVENE